MAKSKDSNNIICEHHELRLIESRVNDGIKWNLALKEYEIHDQKYQIGDNVLIESNNLNKIVHIVLNTSNNSAYCGVRPYLSAQTIKSKFEGNGDEINSIFKKYEIEDHHKILQQKINWHPMSDILSKITDFHCEYEWDLDIKNPLIKINKNYQCNEHISLYNGDKNRCDKLKILKSDSNHLLVKHERIGTKVIAKNKRLIITSSCSINRKKNNRKRKWNHNDYDEPSIKKQKIEENSDNASSENRLLKLRKNEDLMFNGLDENIENLYKENQRLRQKNDEQSKRILRQKKEVEKLRYESKMMRKDKDDKNERNRHLEKDINELVQKNKILVEDEKKMQLQICNLETIKLERDYLKKENKRIIRQNEKLKAKIPECDKSLITQLIHGDTTKNA